MAPGPDNLWLIQPLREKVLCTIKEALLLSSTAFLVFCGCLSLHWQVWSDEGAKPWVVEVLRWGIPDSLPLGSHLIQGSHPFTGVCLQFHQEQSSGWRGSGSADQECLRAGSASISRLLQPVIHGYESFRGVETGHRPFHSELEDSADILQDGDTSIRSSLGSSGGLDGVSGLEGGVLAGANAPEFTQVPQVHGGGKVHQFRVFCFGFSTALQVFTRAWLLCQRFYTGWGYDFVATWTPGCFRRPHASRFSLFRGQSSNSAGASVLLSIGRSLR